MSRSIENQIECIGQSIGWLNKSTIINWEKKREELIKVRRNLTQVAFAQTVNPAIAIYGASQVGKSYLVDGLLQNVKGDFKIKGGNGALHSFLKELDPQGQGSESTSVITRFTIKDECLGSNPNFPIKAVIMSPVEVILTLCDTYYNDIRNRVIYKTDELTTKINAIKDKFAQSPSNQTHIKEDDIYEVKNYLVSSRNFPNKLREVQDLDDANYFREVSLLIDRVPIDNWSEVFSILWGEVKAFTNIFHKMISALKKLQFHKEVFIPIEGLLNKKGTLLSVDRLNEFFGIEIAECQKCSERDVNILISTDQIISISKGEFCALSLEYIFRISEDAAKDKPFLETTDLLDFPGARSRKIKNIESLQNETTDEDGKVVKPEKNQCELLIRGKVAYFFNKYTEQYLIDILLVCYEDRQNEVATLPSLIASWVLKSIGNTIEKREEKIKRLTLSPLFIVGTKYNNDLRIDPISNDVEKKWINRFNKFLCAGLVEMDSDIGSWFNNWTTTNKLFRNIYLLRSLLYTKQARIFKTKDEEITELDYENDYTEHIKTLKTSFLNFPFIKKRFTEDEAKQLWEDTSTPNKDGSQRIIDNLCIVSKNAFDARLSQFKEIIDESYQEIIDILDPLYHTGNRDALILQAMEHAGMIQAQMALLFRNDPYFFSQFISTLHISESELHDQILRELNDPDNLKKSRVAMLVMTRLQAKITSEDTPEIAKEKIRKSYHFTSIEKVDEYLKKAGSTIEDIILPPPSRSFSTVIAEAIEQYWLDTTLAPERFSRFNDNIQSMDEFLKRVKILYKDKLAITRLIIDTINPYVTDAASTEAYVEMIADMSAEIINRFVNEMGFCYFTREMWNEIAEMKEQNNLELDLEVEQDDNILIPGANQVNAVFDVLKKEDDNGQHSLTAEELQLLPYVIHQYRWTKLMKIGFVATCDRPTYNVQENARLQKILNRLDPDNTKYHNNIVSSN